MFFERTEKSFAREMSESKRNGQSGMSPPGSKEISYKRQSRDGPWDSSQVMKRPKQNQLPEVTDSEAALVNAYLEQRRARRHSQFHRMTQIQQDSDTTECDSEESNSGASSWKESESGHHLSPDSLKRRKSVSRPRDLENYPVRERPCLHCKAMRTNEWLTRHFPPSTSGANPVKGEIQEENLTPGVNTKLSTF
ncbi:serine-rich single-pass membrane protein 1 isoform X1 [Sigmodon hispidus]